VGYIAIIEKIKIKIYKSRTEKEIKKKVFDSAVAIPERFYILFCKHQLFVDV
jgi:hypothetical protein